MLLHDEPRRLFSSLYTNMADQQNQSGRTHYKRFTFSMAIPDLQGVKVRYCGPISGSTVFMREILAFSNLPGTEYAARLYHPRKKEPVQPDSGGKATTLYLPVPDDVQIDEQADDASTGNYVRFVDTRPVSISYSVEPQTEMVYGKQRLSDRGRKRDIQPKAKSGTITGSLGDPVKNSTAVAVEYAQAVCPDPVKNGDLSLFKAVAEQLAMEKGWRCNIEYYDLPRVSRSHFRLLGDRPRPAGLATFELPDGLTRHLLEVQISDGHYLSTLLISASEPTTKDDCQVRVRLLLRILVKGAGHWKESLLNEQKGRLQPFTVKKIRHPAKVFEIDRVEAIKRWCEVLDKIK